MSCHVVCRGFVPSHTPPVEPITGVGQAQNSLILTDCLRTEDVRNDPFVEC